MIVQMFKFKSRLPDEEVRRVMRQRAHRFEAQPGLVQKYYGHEPSTGMHTGIYIWASGEAMQAFAESELAKSIPAAYQVEAPPRIEVFEMIFALRPM
jgi:heme-degrading monooxygenase HmoA